MAQEEIKTAGARLRQAVGFYRFLFRDEKELQDGLEQVLAGAGFKVEREVTLGPGDVVDFLVEPGIAVEVKIGGGLSEVTRQLHRYAQHERVRALVLITSKSRLGNLPATMNGKLVDVVVLLGGIV